MSSVIDAGPGRWVAAEMAEQPAVLAGIAGRRDVEIERIRAALPRDREELGGISLIARGSSDNVAVHARYLLELATGLPVSLVAPSLVTRYHRELRARNHLAVALSQSGRTPEIVTVAEHLASRGATVVAVTNHDDSPLAAASAVTLSVGTGSEIAVPATKTVTGQLALVTLLAEAVAPDGADMDRWTGGATAWNRLAEVVAGVLDDTAAVEDAAALARDHKVGIHLARGLTYAAALEGALKSKETTRRVHEGYSSADFLHGPLTVASPEVLVVAYGADGPVLGDVLDTASAASDLGSPVIAIGAPELLSGLPSAVGLPVAGGLGEALAVVPLVVRGQQLAVSTTLELGMDPDRPVGLNKVTATH
ncbi:SIS domain-containing protein [Nakamurella alba]|nr:SIS domain-containing protein [Nakamurella alba]